MNVPLPEHSPPTLKASLIASALRLLATIAWFLVKLVALFILLIVVFIGTIIWRKS